MYLKSIEIAGFKSFNKRSVLNFNTPISAIVGPNGSGKSNVAESFRFALGEQSIKSLRGKRAEDLIFNGGKDAGRANRAGVKLVLNNTQRILNVDFDEVVIERVVNRDSSSEYYINGSQVRLKDIIELLANANIGASGYQIISQGEADKILNANIKERREMIEDALGLKIFQYKKEESSRKLVKTDENIKQIESLRREIAPHIKFLKKQVEKIESLILMKEKLCSMYHDYFRREEEYINFEKINILDSRANPEEKMKNLEAELSKAKSVLAKSESKDEKSGKIIDIEEKLKGVRQVKDSLMRDIGRVEGEIFSIIRIIKKQEDEANSLKDRKVEMTSVENLYKIIDLEMKEVENSDDISKIKKFFHFVKDSFTDFIKRHSNEDDGSINDLKDEVKNLENQKRAHEEALKISKQKEAELSEEYVMVKNEIEKEKDSNRDAEKAVFRIIAEQNELRNVLSALKTREENLRRDEEELKREFQEAGILVGSSALHFKDFWPIKEDGTPLSQDEIIKEGREAQFERKRAMEKIKIRLEDAGVAGGDDIVKEYKETTERDGFLARELEDLFKSSEALKNLIKELDEKITVEFKIGVQKINIQFQEFFSQMFGGGTASLSVVKEQKKRKSDVELLPEDGGEEIAEEEIEEKEGLDIEVNLPKKKIKGLMMLSGGERALTSIALIFAVSQVNPPPFIILDETDAALDEANSRRYGDMIESLAKYSQLILITHNRETMSRAGVIYGVTMGSDGVSKLLSIQFDEAVAVAK
ncbi:MAG: AAA family ATPase [Minisyncoccia bacterium]